MTQTPPPVGAGRRAALVLASGARNAGELRDWLGMAGLLTETPATADTRPGDPAAVTGKTCTKCGETKPASGFYRRAQSRDRLDSHCKACRTAYRRDYMAAHPEARTHTRRRRAKRGRAATPPIPAALAAVLGAEAEARGVPVTDLLRAMAGTAA